MIVYLILWSIESTCSTMSGCTVFHGRFSLLGVHGPKAKNLKDSKRPKCHQVAALVAWTNSSDSAGSHSKLTPRSAFCLLVSRCFEAFCCLSCIMDWWNCEKQSMMFQIFLGSKHHRRWPVNCLSQAANTSSTSLSHLGWRKQHISSHSYRVDLRWWQVVSFSKD